MKEKSMISVPDGTEFELELLPGDRPGLIAPTHWSKMRSDGPKSYTVASLLLLVMENKHLRQQLRSLRRKEKQPAEKLGEAFEDMVSEIIKRKFNK